MNLKAVREGKLKMKTQEEFAQLLGVSVAEVEKWEDNPDEMPFAAVTRLTTKTGLTIEEVTSYERPKVKPLDVGNSWSKAAFTKQNLTAYISDAMDCSDFLEAHMFLASTISGAVLFSGLGLGLGTSLLWGAMTASVFGPIGMVCGLLLAIGMAIFGGSWEKSVAKKIAERFEENKIVDKYCEGIDKYWDQTKTAFEKGAEELEKSWRDYVENLRKTVKNIKTRINCVRLL